MKRLSIGKAICLTIVICWLSLMALASYAISKCKGVEVHKTVDVMVEVNK